MNIHSGETVAELEASLGGIRDWTASILVSLDRATRLVSGDYRSVDRDHAEKIENLKVYEAWMRWRLAGARLKLARAKGLPEQICLRLERLQELYASRSSSVQFLSACDAAIRRDERIAPDYDPVECRTRLSHTEDAIARLEHDLAPHG